MSYREVLTEPVVEKTTRRFVATLKDESDPPVPIAGSQLETCTATLYVLDAALTLIGTEDRNVKPLVDANGVLTMELTPTDNALVDPTLTEESHLILIEWTYPAGTGTKAGKHEIQFTVRNLGHVT